MDGKDESRDAAAGVETATTVAKINDRESIAARIGAKGDFIRVPQLARIIGISSTAIHAQMRVGTFPMPHRRVGNVIVVKLDDYVDWFSSDAPGRASGSEPNDKARNEHPEIPRDPADDSSTRSPAAPPPSTPETADEFKARLARQVLGGMRRKGFDV